MSLSQDLRITEFDNTQQFTSDELLLVRILDPKFKSLNQQQIAQENDMNNENFLRRAQENPLLLQGIPDNMSIQPSEGINSGVDGSGIRPIGYSGGFAVLPILAAAAPLIGSLVGPIFSTITSLFKKKKGRGVNPIGGNAMIDYIQSRIPVYKELEEKLFTLHGADFWKSLKEIAKHEATNIAENGRNFGLDITRQGAQHIGNQIVNKMLPKFIDKLKSEPNKSGSGSVDIIRPVAKYALKKLFNLKGLRGIRNKIHDIDNYIYSDGTSGRGKYAPSVIDRVNTLKGTRKYYMDKLDDELNRDNVALTGEIRGSGIAGVKNITKRILSKILPASSKLISGSLDAILSKFGIENSGISDIAANVIDASSNSIAGVLESDIQEEIDEKKEMKAKINKRKEKESKYVDEIEDLQIAKKYDDVKKKLMITEPEKKNDAVPADRMELIRAARAAREAKEAMSGRGVKMAAVRACRKPRGSGKKKFTVKLL